MWRSLSILSTTVTLFVIFCGRAYSFDSKEIDLVVRGGASESYDDNITYAEDNTKSDLITNLRFGIGAKYEGKLASAELGVNTIQQIFAYHPNYNNNAQDAFLSCEADFSKYDRIALSDKFSHTYEPRSFEEAFGITTGRYSYIRNRFNIDYTHDLTKNANVIVRYANAIDLPSRDDISDSYLNSAGVELDYAFSSATIVYASYDASVRKFDPGNSAVTQEAAGGLRQYITKQVYFDGRAGADYINSYNDEDYFKPMFTASLTDEIDRNTSASLSFTKEYYTTAYLKDVFDYWQISGAISRHFTERLAASSSAFYGHGKYIATAIKDDLFGIDASLSYDITKHIKGVARYSYSMVSSNMHSREYGKNTVYIGLSAEF